MSRRMTWRCRSRIAVNSLEYMNERKSSSDRLTGAGVACLRLMLKLRSPRGALVCLHPRPHLKTTRWVLTTSSPSATILFYSSSRWLQKATRSRSSWRRHALFTPARSTRSGRLTLSRSMLIDAVSGSRLPVQQIFLTVHMRLITCRIRFMALNDLMTEIAQDRNLFLQDETAEIKVLNQVLALVEDNISEVKNQAVKW